MHPRPSSPPPEEVIACDVCLAEIPPSVAASQEASEYVQHFFGVSCYLEWQQNQPVPTKP